VIPPSDRYCAAVCRNGHIIKDHLDPPPRPFTSMGPPVFVEGSGGIGAPTPELPRVPPRCGRCGARVLEACRSCDAPILGAVRLYMQWAPMERPDSFCWRCGEPYPWATREERVGQLYDLVDDEDLDRADLLTVQEEIAVLSRPDDKVTDEERVRAGETIRRLAPKAWEVFLPVAQSLLTAEVKRRLGLSHEQSS
jgi:hypothetical protein